MLEACWNIDLYNSDLLRVIGTRSLAFDAKDQLQILSHFYKINYLCKELIDDFTRKVDLANLTFLEAVKVVEVLADASHTMKIDRENLVPRLIKKLQTEELLDFPVGENNSSLLYTLQGIFKFCKENLFHLFI